MSILNPPKPNDNTPPVASPALPNLNPATKKLIEYAIFFGLAFLAARFGIQPPAPPPVQPLVITLHHSGNDAPSVTAK